MIRVIFTFAVIDRLRGMAEERVIEFLKSEPHEFESGVHLATALISFGRGQDHKVMLGTPLEGSLARRRKWVAGGTSGKTLRIENTLFEEFDFSPVGPIRFPPLKHGYGRETRLLIVGILTPMRHWSKKVMQTVHTTTTTEGASTMLRSQLTLIVLLTIMAPGIASAQANIGYEPQIRLLLHGTKSLYSFPDQKAEGDHTHRELRSVGLGFWIIEPNLLDRNLQFQAVIGPRLQGAHGWIELMGGVNSSVDIATAIDTEVPVAYTLTPVLDLRASMAPSRRVHLFMEGTLNKNGTYTFLQLDFPIRSPHTEAVILKIGVEGSGFKQFVGTGGFIGGGPHVVIPWSQGFATVFTVRLDCRNDGTDARCTSGALATRMYLVFNVGS